MHAVKPDFFEPETDVVMSVPRERVESRQSTPNALQLPILIAVVLVAKVVSQVFPPGPSATVLGVCAGVAVVDVFFAWYFLRDGGATLVITTHDITFTRRQGLVKKGPVPRLCLTNWFGGE